jgi:hypothetical protein
MTTLSSTMPVQVNLAKMPICRGLAWSMGGRFPADLAGYSMRLVLAPASASNAPVILDSNGHGITLTPDPDNAGKTRFVIELSEAQTLTLPAGVSLRYWWSITQPTGVEKPISSGTIPVLDWPPATA